MNIMLFRVEKEKIHFIDCSITDNNLTAGEKKSISLAPASCRGEKYQLIMDGLSQLQKNQPADRFIYRSGQGFRGNIDEIRYTNEAMLTYFAYSNGIEIDELTQSGVRKKLGLNTAEFKTVIEKETTALRDKYGLAKSDKILESLVFLSALRFTY